jgi:hypothetical protein
MTVKRRCVPFVAGVLTGVTVTVACLEGLSISSFGSSLLFFSSSSQSHSTKQQQQRPRSFSSTTSTEKTIAATTTDDSGRGRQREFLERMDALFFGKNGSVARTACERLDVWWNAVDDMSNNQSDNRLYFDCMDALESAQRQVNQRECHEPLLFHVFWADGPLSEVATLSIRSVLHSQPRGCFRVLLSTTNTRTERLLSDRMSRYKRHSLVDVQRLNSTDLIHRIMSNFPGVAKTLSSARHLLESWDRVGAGDNDNPVKLSDAVRFVLLAAYGGVYLDADNLVLKSLQPLANRDFAYSWAFEGYANTAVLGLRLGSPNSGALLGNVMGAARTAEDLNRWFHPENFTKLVRQMNADVDILPSTYFDAVWVINDGYKTPKKAMKQRYGISTFEDLFDYKPDPPVQRTDFLPGCFVYHWHNQWEKSIVNGTLAKAFLDYYDEREAAEGLVD